VKREDRYHAQLPVGALLGVAILTEVVLLLLQRSDAGAPAAPPAATSPARAAGNTEAIGEVLYSTYVFPFEVASLILLVAMIGAIVLAKRDLFEGHP
jgi:NADH-quinone oxidoreductase subunit J